MCLLCQYDPFDQFSFLFLEIFVKQMSLAIPYGKIHVKKCKQSSAGPQPQHTTCTACHCDVSGKRSIGCQLPNSYVSANHGANPVAANPNEDSVHHP